MNILKELIVPATILLVLDFIFLGANQKMFENQIISVQRTALQMKPLGAIACYIFLILGLYYFIIRRRRSIGEAFLLGLIIYGVYETTTYSLLKNWNIHTVMVDTLWGGVLFGFTTFLTYHIMALL